MPNQQHAVKFGVFEVDLQAGEIRKAGMRQKLAGQPFHVLQVLLEHPQEIVTREELRERLWPGNIQVDYDLALKKAVNRLREVLGDSADSPRFIETIPRRGYRFIPTLDRPLPDPLVSSAANSGHQVISARSSRIGRTLWKRMAFGAAVVLVLVALIWVGAIGRYRVRAGNSPPSIRSIAVLPLVNLSNNPEQEYFADGMTDALITDLSKIGSLRIISRTSAMHYKKTNKTVPEIATELNVDCIVEGSITRSGNRLRITAQLIQASTDQHLWGDSYERDLGDVLKLQSEVAQAIAQQVRVQLTPRQKTRLSVAHTVNPDAYDAYLRGRSFDFATLQGIERARKYFEAAIQKDPVFALGYVGLADCYISSGQFRLVSPQDSYPRGKEAVRKALELDQTLAEAHGSLAFLSWQWDWNWRTAEEEYRYALDLNPNSINLRTALLWYLAWRGRRDEALAEIAKIRELDPANPYTFLQEAGIYYHLRNYPALLDVSKKSVALNPNDWAGHYFVAVADDGLNHPLEAIPEYQKAVELSQDNTDPIGGLAHAYATAGQRANAELILRELLRRSRKSYVSPYMIGAIYAGLGNKDRAFEFLEKAYDERSSDIPYFLKADLRIDNLRSDSRFQDLLHRVGLPQ